MIGTSCHFKINDMKKIRISIDDHLFILGNGIRVFVNGKEHHRVVEADERKGYIIKHALNEQGHAYVDKKYGEVAMDTVVGKVKIKLPFPLWWMRLPKWMGGM